MMLDHDPVVRNALLRDLAERSRFRRVTTGAIVLACLGVGVAAAAPASFSAGEPLSAAKLNKELADLDTRMAALETKKPSVTNGTTGRSISIGASFCGVTPTPVVGSATGGYDKAAAACQVASGCRGSATAHMCTGDELARTRMLGADVPTAWYSSGTNNKSFFNSAEHDLNDCTEWSSAVLNQLGSQWKAQGVPGPGYAGCSSSAPIACCD